MTPRPIAWMLDESSTQEDPPYSELHETADEKVTRCGLTIPWPRRIPIGGRLAMDETGDIARCESCYPPGREPKWPAMTRQDEDGTPVPSGYRRMTGLDRRADAHYCVGRLCLRRGTLVKVRSDGTSPDSHSCAWRALIKIEESGLSAKRGR